MSTTTEDYVVQEHVKLDEVLSGRPYMRLVKRMTVSEFLGTDQPTAVKQGCKLFSRRKMPPSLKHA